MGYHERTYTKVVAVSNGMSFASGPRPKALMVNHNMTVICTDFHGNQFTIGEGSSSNSQVTRIFDGISVKTIKTVTAHVSNGARAYVLF